MFDRVYSYSYTENYFKNIMLSPKDNTNLNEPLLSRHARFMHALASKGFRAGYMADFDQAHAAAVLRPSHLRRAMDVEAASKGAVIRELFIEEMRRQINLIYVRRFSKLMLGVYAALAIATIVTYGALWSKTDELRVAYVRDRGYQVMSKTQAVKAKAAAIAEGAKEKAAETKGKLAAYMKARAESKAAEGDGEEPKTIQPTKTDVLKQRLGAWINKKAEQAKAEKEAFDRAGQTAGDTQQ